MNEAVPATATAQERPHATKPREPIPIVVDTDIGDDIDDTWAIALLLRSPELSPKLILTSNGDTRKRAQILAKFLTLAGRSDIDIGIGPSSAAGSSSSAFMKAGPGSHYDLWAKDFDLSGYGPGKVHQDGIQALLHLAASYPAVTSPLAEPQEAGESEDEEGRDGGLTLLALAPLSNVAAALRRNPLVAQKFRLVGMLGSIARPQRLEYNVAQDVEAAKLVLGAAWRKPLLITPLDTCGLAQLNEERYALLRAKAPTSPLCQALMECSHAWALGMPGMVRAKPLWRSVAPLPDDAQPLVNEESSQGSQRVLAKSSTLFDCVAVYLAFSAALLAVERLRLKVDAVGRTIVLKDGKEEEGADVLAATSWKDLNAFHDLLVDRLLS
ncbi:Inosine-uridine nucleoside N-ribohydrolase [Balamuthia mandrillaris]